MKIFLSLTILLLTLSSIHAQSPRHPLDQNASLSQTLDWLKTNIPYAFVQPQSSERRALTRESISHLRVRDCVLDYEITSQSLPTAPPGAVDYDQVRLGAEQQQWRVDLAGLNPRMIRLQPPSQPNRPPRITFTSFDPNSPEVASQMRSNVGSLLIYEGRAIWHADRMGAYSVRQGYVPWAAIPVRDQARGEEIVSALKQAVKLCRQAKPGKLNP